MKVYVIDEIMGAGKTSAMINMINASPSNKKFLFITPYCDEDVRIQRACPTKNFQLPVDENGTKLMDIKRLMREGRNIASTHALFTYFDQDIIDLVIEQKYTLVIDEAMGLINKPEISDHDIRMLFAHHIEVDEDTSVRWITPDYTGKLYKEKRDIESGMYKCYGSRTLLWVLPFEIFCAFNEVYLMTYLYEHTYHACYFKINGVEYERLYVKGNSPESYEITSEPQCRTKVDYRSLIHICDDNKLNSIGNDKNALSSRWYERNKFTQEFARLTRNTYNFFRWYAKSKSNDNMWTTFAKYVDVVKGSGFSPSRNWLACNAKATNSHKHRTALAYLVNRYVDPNVRNWMFARGARITDDGFALSEMVQWIWRSAIRDGKEIWIYIPSRRMRTLLINWMDALAEGMDYTPTEGGESDAM